MDRLTWTQTRDGWRSGRYQIELAAPHLWVLSRRARKGDQPVHPATIIDTGGSLRELKRAAAEFEGRRGRVRRLFAHLLAAILLSAATAVLNGIGSLLFIPASAALFAVLLHSAVIWVDMLTGAAWARLSDVYQ